MTALYQAQSISNADWTRFDHNARRVRVFGVGSTPRVIALCSLHRQLAEYRPGSELFPFLHTLGLNGKVNFTLSMRLPQSLRVLEIRFGHEDQHSNNGEMYILSAISQAPLLEKLTLNGLVNPMLLVHIASFKSLRCFDLRGVKFTMSTNGTIREGLKVMLDMNTLTELTLPRALGMDDIPSGIYSRNLTTVDICGEALLVTKIVGTLSRTTTHTITIQPRNTILSGIKEESTTQWGLCLDQLRTHCGASLRCIVFHPNVHHDVDFIELIKPLLQLDRLEEFHSGTASVSADGMNAMAVAWPNLRSLRLAMFIRDNTLISNEHAPTIQSLICFARLCTKLHTLQLRLLDINLPSSVSFPLLSHRLQQLHLDVPFIRDYLQLAILVDRIFPRLSRVSVDSECNDEFRGWVPRIIGALQSVRKERRLIL